MNWNKVESLRCRSNGFNIPVPPNNSSTQYFNTALQIHHVQPGFFNKPLAPPFTNLRGGEKVQGGNRTVVGAASGTPLSH